MRADGSLRPEPFLAALGVHDAAAVTPVSGGTATAIWRVERAQGASALRVFRPGEEPVWRREIAAMGAARAAGVPVPDVAGSAIVDGRPALLLSWCAGETLADALGKRPWLIVRLGRAFGRAQAAIHQAAPPALGAEAGDWIAAAGPEEAELQRQLRHAPGARSALLHLDYHPRNVLVDGRGVTAVLDWANAYAGDPRADVARTYTILVVEPWQAAPEPARLSLIRRVLAAAWRSGYESAAGPLGDLRLHYAWAGTVMARDLAYRVDDPASWWEPRHMEHIRSWTARWKRLAGITD